MKRLAAIVLTTVMIFFGGVFRISGLSQYQNPSYNMELEDDFDISDFRNNTYRRKLDNWLETYEYSNLEELTLSLDDFADINPGLVFTPDASYENNDTITLSKNDSLVFEVDVEETGLYEIGFDFLMPEEFFTIPTMEITVNDQILYNELRELEMDVSWQVVPLPETEKYNRYGNELLPKSESVSSWKKYYLSDFYALSDGNFQFLLNAGNNEIKLTAQNLDIKIGNLYIKGKEELPAYSDYQAENKDILSNSEGEILTVQGESFVYKNDLEIKSSYYKESAMTPYTYKNTVLNQLDGNSMSRGGTKVTYEFTVTESGYYKIAFKTLQNQNLGISVGKNIYLDGEIPFKELKGYLFESSRKWVNNTLGNEEEDFLFFLSEGSHSLSIESTVIQYEDYIDELNLIMDNISSISLLVKTITGGNNSDTVDWDILKYIPDLVERLEAYATRLETIFDEIDEIDQGVSGAGEVSTLNVAAKQLRRIADNPNRIGSKLQEFSEGSGSAYQLIGNAISYMMAQPLSIDVIYLYNDVELPKANGSFFRKLWDGIRGFFYSFFDTRYNDNDVDEDTLEVWVGQSTLYLDIIQSMIDQDFTKETGIKVKASIMNNVQKIVLSNATNDNPDAVLAIDNWNPYP